MPRYYVSKSVSPQVSLIYVQYHDSWSAIRPDGRTSAAPGALPSDIVERANEIASRDAYRLIGRRQPVAYRRCCVQEFS